MSTLASGLLATATLTLLLPARYTTVETALATGLVSVHLEADRSQLRAARSFVCPKTSLERPKSGEKCASRDKWWGREKGSFSTTNSGMKTDLGEQMSLLSDPFLRSI